MADGGWQMADGRWQMAGLVRDVSAAVAWDSDQGISYQQQSRSRLSGGRRRGMGGSRRSKERPISRRRPGFLLGNRGTLGGQTSGFRLVLSSPCRLHTADPPMPYCPAHSAPTYILYI
jgi:hypothetical protein